MRRFLQKLREFLSQFGETLQKLGEHLNFLIQWPRKIHFHFFLTSLPQRILFLRHDQASREEGEAAHARGG